MNPRISYGITPTSFRLNIDGSEFKFNQNDVASRNAAQAALEAHAEKVIAALDARAGRRLTARELIHGVDHVETRPISERVTITKPADPTVVNPYQRMLDENLVPGKKESPRKRIERLAAEFEQKQLTAAEQQAFASDSQRIRAVQHAEGELRRLRHDPSITVAEIEEAEGRVELARAGDLKQYAAEDREWRKVLAEKLAERAAPIDQQIAALREQKQAILAGAFDDPPPPVVVESQPSQFSDIPVERMTQSEFDEARAKDRELVARQKEARR